MVTITGNVNGNLREFTLAELSSNPDSGAVEGDGYVNLIPIFIGTIIRRLPGNPFESGARGEKRQLYMENVIH